MPKLYENIEQKNWVGRFALLLQKKGGRWGGSGWVSKFQPNNPPRRYNLAGLRLREENTAIPLGLLVITKQRTEISLESTSPWKL